MPIVKLKNLPAKLASLSIFFVVIYIHKYTNTTCSVHSLLLIYIYEFRVSVKSNLSNYWTPIEH